MSLSQKQLEFLIEVEKVCKAVDTEVDWFIASFQERDPDRRKLYRFICESKREVTKKLAKETYERYTEINN